MTASASTPISTRRRTLVRALAATPIAKVSAFASTSDARAQRDAILPGRIDVRAISETHLANA
ncbi:hypothetical protein OKW46_000603 [Paraburkholderia sp. WSM4179]|uniref:hypothetical protein n=1 Tax=Paraburkholderia sp. WSM4179 TaxID=2991073 RepID=UPI0003A268DA|nr:hypothetical protein [Paraburkholderia sp. WSM4179]MDH6146681.1 hypothetical protein [Paraburkholderia sp. WSM4179]